MGARIWCSHGSIHAATCPCILCRAERVKPELPMAKLVPPWWVRVWSVWVIVTFLGCRTPEPVAPVISNRALPRAPITVDQIPPLQPLNWIDRCYYLDMQMEFTCLSGWVTGDPNVIYCGCCPDHMPHWLCRHMF